jgi:predicted DNA-binding antitoxin AbrB/MazE fold protein
MEMSDIITAVYENGLLRPLEHLSLSEHQTVRLHVLSPQVRVSATAARRRVSGFVLNEISYLMGGGEPTLVIGERTVWRVPVILTFPTDGPVGTVGTIEVDAETGELHTSPQLIEEITRNAETLAGRLPPETETEG